MIDEVSCLVNLGGLLNLPRLIVTDTDHIWFQIPSTWVDALVNNDDTKLRTTNEKEREAFRKFMYYYVDAGKILSVGQSPYFSKHHDARPYGVLPCDVVDVKVGYDYDPC